MRSKKTSAVPTTDCQVPAGKAYLSPMIDCLDGMVVSWTIGTSHDAELVNTMLDMAIAGLPDGKHPDVHSNRGSLWRLLAWISRMENARFIGPCGGKGVRRRIRYASGISAD